jgi:AraC-like DNA-binding protein
MLAQHFTPYQPIVSHSKPNDVCYTEHRASKSLDNYVYCFWNLKSKRKLDESFTYRVVSDGCIDLLFSTTDTKVLYATGFSRSYQIYELGKEFNYFGIRFYPAALPLIIGKSASLLVNQFIDLNQITPDFNKIFLDILLPYHDLTEFQIQAELKLTNWVHSHPPAEIDTRIVKASTLIFESKGQIPITEIDVGLSQRQLRRLFDFYFGASPKTFAQIVRFQSILGSISTLDDLKEKAFFDQGYFDQAHFTKEFKSFYGISPFEAYRKM